MWAVICYSVYERRIEKFYSYHKRKDAKKALNRLSVNMLHEIKETNGSAKLHEMEDGMSASLIWLQDEEEFEYTYEIIDVGGAGKYSEGITRKKKNGNRSTRNGQCEYKRLCKVDIAEVRKMYDQHRKFGNDDVAFAYFDERINGVELIEVDMSDDRYENFFENGTTCVTCGIEGKYFWLEKCMYTGKKNRYGKYHFNLYGLDSDGNEVMLTKDHRVAKSKGGSDTIDNYQPMCAKCNESKGDMSMEDFCKANCTEEERLC